MYFKIAMRAGHHGTGRYEQQSLYVRGGDLIDAVNIARKFPSIKHSLAPLSTMQIGEDEYIINALIDARRKHFDNEIVPMGMDTILNFVIPSIQKEQQFDPDYKQGKLAKKLFELCEEYKNATTDEEKDAAYKTLRGWILDNYNRQEEILNERENENF